MKKWFKFMLEYPNGAGVHHNIWIAWQACLSVQCMVLMDRPDVSAVQCRMLWWLSLLALFNGIWTVIHYECFVKPDYWKPKDKKK